MKLVIALDTDGTLETSNGPVKIQWLVKLRDNGATVCVVSPSLFYPRDGANNPRFELVNSAPDREENLRKVATTNPGADLYVYISDNAGDDVRARNTGFTYVHPVNFQVVEMRA